MCRQTPFFTKMWTCSFIVSMQTVRNRINFALLRNFIILQVKETVIRRMIVIY